MEPANLAFLVEDDEDKPFSIDLEVDLYFYADRSSADPDSKDALYVERAVLRVFGVEVPKEFTSSELDRLLALYEQEQELAEENRKIIAHWRDFSRDLPDRRVA